MGARYSQLDLEERCAVARLQVEGRSVQQIAAALDRAPSTIARELNRNAGRDGYRPGYAQEQARARALARLAAGARRGPARAGAERAGARALAAAGLGPAGARGRPGGDLAREHLPLHLRPDLARQAEPSGRLAPLSVAGQGEARLARSQGRQLGRPHSAAAALERASGRRRRPPPGRPLGGRPDALFGRSGPALLMLHERHSRLLLALPVASKAAAPIARLLVALLRRLAAGPAPHGQLRQRQRVRPAPRAAPARGRDVLLRRLTRPGRRAGSRTRSAACAAVLPRRLELAQLSIERLVQVLQLYNNTPRKCLDYPPRPKSSASNWRTCNVNPPSCLRRNDGGAGGGGSWWGEPPSVTRDISPRGARDLRFR